MQFFFDRLMLGELKDVMIAGYIDYATLPIFHPFYDRLYFIIDEVIFELYLSEAGIIQYNELTEIKAWLTLDDDGHFSLMSIYSQLFKTEQAVIITDITYSSIPFSSMSISYVNGQDCGNLLFDPNHFFGFTFL